MIQMLIQSRIVRVVTVTIEASKRVKKCDAEGLCRFCLEPIAEGERVVRKCHQRCDKANRRGVVAGDWTDEEQQAKGNWGPPERTGRPARQPAVLTDSKVAP